MKKQIKTSKTKSAIALCLTAILLIGCNADNTKNAGSLNLSKETTIVTSFNVSKIISDNANLKTNIETTPQSCIEKRKSYLKGALVSWTEYEYDDMGKLLNLINFDTDGNIKWAFLYEYDSDGNCIKETKYNSDASVDYWLSYEYDRFGNNLSKHPCNLIIPPCIKYGQRSECAVLIEIITFTVKCITMPMESLT